MELERIYLIGFMGSGKSTIGKLLAEYLNWNFIDLDTLIEQTQKKTIPLIFEQEGENSFRKYETRAIQQIKTKNKIVIATGGGAPCYNNNMEEMNKTGITVYLKLDANKLSERLCPIKDSRPLIANKTKTDLLDFINYKLPQRETIYNKANIIADAETASPQSIISSIKTYLNNCLPEK